MHILLDDVDKAELEDRIQQNENSIGQLSDDNVSYKEHTVDDSLRAIGTTIPLVNRCITISEVLRTFFIKTIKLYVKSSVKDTITIKLLEEPEYNSNAYYETSVEVEADTNKLVEIEVSKSDTNFKSGINSRSLNRSVRSASKQVQANRNIEQDSEM